MHVISFKQPFTEDNEKLGWFLFPVSLGTECFIFQGKNVSCRDKKIKDIELMSWTPVIKEINTIIGRFLGTNVGKKSN
jgi:hypothetical protein